MSAAKKLTAVEILTPLEEDPKVSFFAWELDVRNVAASICKTLTPRGLLSLLLTDVQWASYPANSSIDDQGHVVIAPRYVPRAYVELNEAMSNVAMMVARTNNEQALEWITGEEALKAAIIKSLGNVIRQIVRDPTDGFTLMTVMDIVNKVRTRYGRMRKNTQKSLAERMTSRLTSTEQFDTHVSNLRENFVISHIGGYTVQPDKQVDLLKESLAGHALIEKILNQYDFEHKDETLHTFESIVAYVEDHLPNLQESTRVSASATAHIMSSAAYTTLEAENKKLKAAQIQSQTKKRKGGKGKGKDRKPKKNRSNKDDKDAKPDRPLKYCHAHGTQHTHTSSECKLMAGDKDRFTSAMRNAKNPNQPPGGSTKLLGQEAE